VRTELETAQQRHDTNRAERSTHVRHGRIGYAPGAYDLFHVGHLNILKRSKAECDYLIAGVASDEMLELMKGRRPVVPTAERLAIVESIVFVDEAVVEVGTDRVETWRQIGGFDVLFKGDDWRGTAKGDKLEADFAAVGVEIFYFPYTMHTSSTILRRALDDMQRPAAPSPAASR
jgi:cytidyltransferase-related domain